MLKVIYMSPQGQTLNQAKVESLAKRKTLNNIMWTL